MGIKRLYQRNRQKLSILLATLTLLIPLGLTTNKVAFAQTCYRQITGEQITCPNNYLDICIAQVLNTYYCPAEEPIGSSKCSPRCVTGQTCVENVNSHQQITYTCMYNVQGCNPSCGIGEQCVGIGQRYSPVCRKNADQYSGGPICTPSECVGGQCINGQCYIDGICTSCNNQGEQGDPKSLNELVEIIFNILMPTAVIIGILLILKAGYTLMTSQGDPSKTQDGKEQLTSAIMGLLFVLLSIGILRAIVSTLITG